MAIKIGFICPTYKALELTDYTEIALASFFATTPNAHAIVVDDASKGWSRGYEQRLQAVANAYSSSAIQFKHFAKNGGVTRSWNAGLALAKEQNLDYVIAGNNDVVFTKGWYVGMLQALQSGFSLVGPLSNAPGDTAKGAQQVNKYIKNYTLSDDFEYLNDCADVLFAKNYGKVINASINGFFQFAAMDSWEAGKYSKELYYCPVNKYSSTGKKNLTPLMTLNEDELQRRWRAKKMKSAVVLSSFIFHYRAVTRGGRYKKGLWYRR